MRSSLILAVLLALPAVLATLQYRWIGQVSAGERDRLRAGLRAAATRFSDDFDREIARTFVFFHGGAVHHPTPPEQYLAGRYRRWLAESPYPKLVRGVFFVGREVTDKIELRCFDAALGRFTSCPQAAELARALREPLRRDRFQPRLEGQIPALVVHCEHPIPAAGEERRDLAIIRLDLDVLVGELLPELSARHFGSAVDPDYAVVVTDRNDPGHLIYGSPSELPEMRSPDGDVSRDLFTIRWFHELRHLVEPPPNPEPDAELASGDDSRSGESRDSRFVIVPRRAPGWWRLVVVHRAGSLDAAVAAVRRRNLAISAGILLVLVGSVILAYVSAQRARRLARQQLDFLAGVSHELHTPVTAIRSAAENLADGLVVDPQEVKEYGAILDHEGRRLSKMVNEVLELAGMQGRRRRFCPQPVPIARIVDGAVEDSRWSLDEHQVEVERIIPAELPWILADPEALQRAVHNLIENAVKYGGAKRWLGLRAAAANASQERREVTLTVADRGPGIRRVDLRHVFEPFYQGRVGGAAPASGSGLGLSLVKHIVEQHGGRVSIDTGNGGTEVTIRLPAVDAARETATDRSGVAG